MIVYPSIDESPCIWEVTKQQQWYLVSDKEMLFLIILIGFRDSQSGNWIMSATVMDGLIH